MGRLTEEVTHPRALDDLPGIEHRHLATMLRNDAEVARYEQCGRVQLVHEILDKIEDLSLDRYVEPARGFVSDQQAGIIGQRHRDGDSLRHAAAQLMRKSVHSCFWIRNANLRQHEDGVLDSIGFSRGMRSDDVDELSADRDQRIERRFCILNHQPYFASSDFLQGSVRLLQQVEIVIADRPRNDPARHSKIDQRHGKRGFSRPALPNNAKELPFPTDKSTPLTASPTP